jgi:Tfp pilus assembly protein PilX
MTAVRAILQRTDSDNDRGIALIGVVLAMAVLSLLLLSSLAYALQSSKPARADQDAKTAVAAAEAGIDEYISRLNANDNYWKNGNSDTTNPAFSTAGQVIQGTGTAGARFRYTLLSTASETAQNGQIRLQVTGVSGVDTGGAAVSRTLTATLKPKGFLSYVYLSDIEAQDPSLIAGEPASCGNYHYATATTPARSTTTCNPYEIVWASGDVVNGPLHSNDSLKIEGPVTFKSAKTETSWPAAMTATKTWWGSQNAPLGAGGFLPKYAPHVDLPESNNKLLANVEPDVDGDATTPVGPGCYYTGATRIILQGTTMRVLSPSTKSTSTPARCYAVGTAGTEQTVAIPPVIYVDSTTATCVLGAVGYPAAGEEYTLGTATDVAWKAPSASDANTNYACSRGSAYVQGSSATQVTIAAKDDVVITGNVTLAGGLVGTNVVGLIAGNCVWVYHPLKDGTTTNQLTTGNHVNNISAAILALRHSFVVQNARSGAGLGTLNVSGSIAQKHRGIVGTSGGSTGYIKNYFYDNRLSYLQPPFFLTPSSSPWQLSTMTDK